MAGERRPRWFTAWAKGKPPITVQHAWVLWCRANEASDRDAAPLFRQFYEVVDGAGVEPVGARQSRLDEIEAKRREREAKRSAG